ncbi:Pex24p-domain-containing protein [Westerdykella ornata]|uniref:Pex24p-domain-containing protein n=1 Tax=Westerdykella ornata TaxID=318751 RepID=A0A6A6J8Q5_WESOR|nr:Pex24p-domain-containing protein [Westerdykella ornata]KAF2272533.1 Pex24p-domain-containing protein [Westerdykella ornata]
MSKQEAKHLANRDEPIPVVTVSSEVGQSAPATPRKHYASEHHLSPNKLKSKLGSLGDIAGLESPSRVSDKLFTMLLSQVLPPEDYSLDGQPSPSIKDGRSRTYVERPAFSLPVMSSNFRRFNARIGVAFIFQNQLIRLFTWAVPTQTLSFLAVYTFICLDPPLALILPLAGILFFIMVPAFLTRHPPAPTSLPTDLYPLSGPPLAAAQTIRPTPELSKDFFRNMRDLQNCMEDFSRAHDAVIAFATPLTNFSNEALSSTIYMILLVTSCTLFISAHLLPWRYIFLLLGYVVTLIGHPTIQDLLSSPPASDYLSDMQYRVRASLLTLSKSDIQLASTSSDPGFETREVEIFELQHRPLHDIHGVYEPYLFSPSPYAPLSPARVAGDRPRGAPFFEDVLPPRGWRWRDKKWTLDLMSKEWVEERCVTGVEVEVEGERWVTDLFYEEGGEGGDQRWSGGKGTETGRRDPAGKEGQERQREVLVSPWERPNREARKGEWRRRRWVRMVERMPVLENDA